ncbi:MAG: isoprenyl transferase [Candidatus Omnitrophica bacterium]|nr:isoprenyl transferase [Candidatus Omnitrophota bacterium]
MVNLMRIPNHIALIIDGNGRWAKKRGLPRTVGHSSGIQRIKEIIDESLVLGIKILTIFAFSTENWNRPRNEIAALFSYMGHFLDDYKKVMFEKNIKFNVIGRRDRINQKFIKKIEKIEDETKLNKSFMLNIALDYGGRWDVVEAAKKILEDFSKQMVSKDDIDEEFFSKYISLSGIPDPDLLIRTSGEQRISNFLIWNLAYSEFYFTPTLWPDFNKDSLRKAVEEYSKRNRRFGEVHE